MKIALTLLMIFTLSVQAGSGAKGVILNRPVLSGTQDLDIESLWLISSIEVNNHPEFEVVDRESLQSLLDEMALGAQSLSRVESSPEIGKLTGASFLLNTRVVDADGGKLATVQCVNMVTSQTRSTYGILEGDNLPALSASLGELMLETLTLSVENQGAEAVKSTPIPQLPESLKPLRIAFWIPEQHINQPVADPAAENEMTKVFLQSGFTVLDLPMQDAERRRGKGFLTLAVELGEDEDLDFLIYGEAISERSDRIGAFEGARARVEVKVVDIRKGEVVLADSGYAGAVDAAESTAAKMALQKAGGLLALSMLDEMIKLSSAE